MLMEEDLEEGVGEEDFFWRGRQVCFLWEPREDCLGNLLTALCHSAEAVDASCSSSWWSDHHSGGAGCSCPRVPKVSAFPLQPSTDQAGSLQAPAQERTLLGLDTRHRVRHQSCSDWFLVN